MISQITFKSKLKESSGVKRGKKQNKKEERLPAIATNIGLLGSDTHGESGCGCSRSRITLL